MIVGIDEDAVDEAERPFIGQRQLRPAGVQRVFGATGCDAGAAAFALLNGTASVNTVAIAADNIIMIFCGMADCPGVANPRRRREATGRHALNTLLA